MSLGGRCTDVNERFSMVTWYIWGIRVSPVLLAGNHRHLQREKRGTEGWKMVTSVGNHVFFPSFHPFQHTQEVYMTTSHLHNDDDDDDPRSEWLGLATITPLPDPSSTYFCKQYTTTK